MRALFVAAVFVAAALLTSGMAATRLWAVTMPTLTIPVEIPADYGQTVRVPITFDAGGKSVVGIGLSLDINPACLSFNASDADGDRSLDAVIFHTPAGITPFAAFDLADPTSELDIALYSLMQIPNGLIVEVEFGTICQPPADGYIVTPVTFSDSYRASFGSPSGQSVAGAALSGSVRIYRPPVPVTPVAPTFTPITACGTYGAVTFAETPGVTYAITQGDGKQGAVGVSATAEAGYVLEGDSGPWTSDLGTYFACPIVATPVEPAVTVIEQCGAYGSVQLATTEGVTYTMEPEDASAGTVTVFASALTGYVLDASYAGPWTYDLGVYRTCAIAEQPVVAAIGGACGVYGSVTFAVTPGVTYSMLPAGAQEGPITVSAVADPGYELKEYTGPWHYDLGVFHECPPGDIVVIPAEPSVTKITTCGMTGSVQLAETEGVLYTASPANATQGIVTVSAAAKPGYVLQEYDGPWVYDLGAYVACPTEPPDVFLPMIRSPA